MAWSLEDKGRDYQDIGRKTRFTGHENTWDERIESFCGLCMSVIVWVGDSVCLLLCGSVTLSLCGSVSLWLRGSVTLCLWLCESVSLWLWRLVTLVCDCVGWCLWLCGSVSLCACNYVGQWLYVSVITWVGVFSYKYVCLHACVWACSHIHAHNDWYCVSWILNSFFLLTSFSTRI